MNTLLAGFSRVNITPMMGIAVQGYFKPRYAEGVLDELYVRALALQCGEDKAVLLSLDHCGLVQALTDAFRQRVAEATGLSPDAIFVSASHTHTAPMLTAGLDDPLQQEYFQSVCHKLVDAATFALQDLKPARMGWGIGQAPNIAFVRRYRMKDGSVRTNPGVDNPEILHPIGNVDERVSVLRFDQEAGQSLVLIHFSNHPDTVGGSKISADWPGFACKTVEQILDNTSCLFFNGTMGDVNHVNTHPRGGYLNDMFMDFDDVARGYHHARYMGRVVAGGVLQAFDKVQYVDVDSLRFTQKVIHVPANVPTAEELPEARHISQLHAEGRDAELPYTGMQLTTKVAASLRMLRLEHGPDTFDMRLSGIALGNVALVGIPGQPFNATGCQIKELKGWDLIVPCSQTNGAEGYYPTQDAYDEGGYEAGSSPFKAGVAEFIVREVKTLLESLK